MPSETSDTTKLLLGDDVEENGTTIWRRRKRRKSSLLPKKLSWFLLVWAVLNVVIILIGVKRLSHTFDDTRALRDYLSPGGDLAPYPLHRRRMEPEAFAPLGASCMILGYLLSILIVFYFICLPFDRDMSRLKKSLFRWLVIDFCLIFLVVVITFSGAFAVIVHDRAHHHHTRERWQRLCWNSALVMSPALVLSFHVMFWKQAYIIYRSIDETKHLVFAIKM